MTRRLAACAALALTLAALVLPGRWYLLSWAPFAAGAWLVLRTDRRAALVLVLAGGLALPLAAARQPPTSSDDVYRYVWDGRVQLAGVDPYRHPPAAPQLRPLREPGLWPAGRTGWCVPDGCTLINRPAVPTIYPPVAEAFFAAVALVAPRSARERPLQLATVAIAAAVSALLWFALARLGGDPRRAVLWAWCPQVALEAGNNAHVDVLAVALAAVAVLLLARAGSRRLSAVGGAVLGLAVATKLTPALLAPALLRRRPLITALTAAGAIATVYLPHVLAVGPAVLGYLPGYLHEEGYGNGTRFALLGMLPPAWATAAAALILAAVALLALRHTDPDRPWRWAAATVGVTLLVTTPAYPWYALLLVMLVAYGAPAAWLAVAFAAYPAQLATDLGISTGTGQLLGYGCALLVLLTQALLTHRRRAWATARGAAPWAVVPRP